MREENKGYENLANAIILQAIKDYKENYHRDEVERFIWSDWFRALTDVAPERIMKICLDENIKIKSREVEL